MNALRLDARFFSTTKFVLKKPTKWTNDKPITDVEKRKKFVATIKKLNWESVKLHGPMLETPVERKAFLKKKRADAERAFVYPAVFHVKEAGFKECDDFTPSCKWSLKTRIVADIAGKNAFREFSPEATKHLDDEPRNADGVFPEKENNAPKRSGRVTAKEDVAARSESLGSSLVTPSWTTRLLERLNALPLVCAQGEVSLQETILSDARSSEMLTDKSSSVSTILQKTMPAESLRALERWKRKMVELLGEDGFREYQQEMFRVGSCLHQCIEDFLSEKPVAELEMDKAIQGHWKSLQPVLADISDVLLLETRVDHPVLKYRGVLDGVVKYRGTNVLVEWKTSQRPKPNLRDTYDNPVQAAAYVGALNYTGSLQFQLAEAAIVVAYPCGSPADVHFLNKDLCQYYWNMWLRRFSKFLLNS